MIALGVNIDHVATIRQARLTRYPDPIHAALVAEQSGADSITLHLREDRRHIQDRDVKVLKEVVQTRINLEMAVTDEMLGIATDVAPEDCCLVPERREELTTEGGLDVATQSSKIGDACGQLKERGIRVALFVDPEERQMEASRKAGADVVEIHTGAYADAAGGGQRGRELSRIVKVAEYAESLGLEVHAGHGLTYHNVEPVAAIEQVTELNIGHAIVARAIFSGLSAAVAEMKHLMMRARQG